MSFFYSTPAGLYDVLGLALITLFALWRGPFPVRATAAIIIFCFLAHRAVITLGTGEWGLVAISAADVLAMICLLPLVRAHWAASAVAALYVAKLVPYVAYLHNLMGWAFMTTAVAAILLLQLLVLLAGACHGISLKRSARNDSGRPAASGLTWAETFRERGP